MKLGLIVEFDGKAKYDDVCLEDPALSKKQWTVGPVSVLVEHRGYVIKNIDGFHVGLIPDLTPLLTVHGSHGFMAWNEAPFDMEKFDVAISEARQYAAAMHSAIREHIAKLAREGAV